jgi:superfamily II DNA/RNA helicase
MPAVLCRAGRPGTVISLITGGEKFVVDKLGRRLGVRISEVELSHGEASERVEWQPPAAREGREPRGPREREQRREQQGAAAEAQQEQERRQQQQAAAAEAETEQ